MATRWFMGLVSRTYLNFRKTAESSRSFTPARHVDILRHGTSNDHSVAAPVFCLER